MNGHDRSKDAETELTDGLTGQPCAICLPEDDELCTACAEHLAARAEMVLEAWKERGL